MRKAWLSLPSLFFAVTLAAGANPFHAGPACFGAIQSLTTTKPVARDSDTATVRSFLKWYAQHRRQIDNFRLVNSPIPADKGWYKVNYANVQKYISALRKSGFFSEVYLTRTYQYFQECDKKLTASKQNDGPPEGLDFDLILYDQDPDGILKEAAFMKITRVTAESNNAADSKSAADPKGIHQVKAETYDNNLIFTMTKLPDRFLIDNIQMKTKDEL